MMSGIRSTVPAIADWNDVESRLQNKPNLILGNGFSISIDSRFAYNSIFDEAVSNGALSAKSQRLFRDDVGRSMRNFEWVLRRLRTASQVATVLRHPAAASDFESQHEAVRHALFTTVNGIHPDRAAVAGKLPAIAHALAAHSTVFTTNYDLLPYWAINEAREVIDGRGVAPPFVDGFSSTDDPLPFDEDRADSQFDTQYPNATRLLYLHGGIHLVALDDTRGAKLRRLQALRALDEDWKQWTPVFVTEGSPEAKMLSIARIDYLRWVRDRLEGTQGDFLVYGQRLDPDVDAHLARAIEDGDDGKRFVAIGVYMPEWQTRQQRSRAGESCSNRSRATPLQGVSSSSTAALTHLPSWRIRRGDGSYAVALGASHSTGWLRLFSALPVSVSTCDARMRTYTDFYLRPLADGSATRRCRPRWSEVLGKRPLKSPLEPIGTG